MRRRRLARLILLASTLLLAMMLVAGPALATEGEESEDATEEQDGEEGEESSGFGTNKADPVIVAAVAGILLGAFAFSQSEPGGIERASDDH